MSPFQTLFERLGKIESPIQKSLDQNHGEAVESILQHLRNLLNTKQGNTLIQPDYGVPDFNDYVYSFPDAIYQIQRSICESIKKFEPRLTNVNVNYIENPDDPLSLRFEITAQLQTSKDKPSIKFQTIMDASGQVEIKG